MGRRFCCYLCVLTLLILLSFSITPQAESAPFDDVAPAPAAPAPDAVPVVLPGIDTLTSVPAPRAPAPKLDSPAERGPTVLQGLFSLKHPEPKVVSAPKAAPRRSAARLTAAPTLRHRIRQGDTLFSLARRYGTSVRAIVHANGLASAHRIREGQLLTIPSRVPAQLLTIPGRAPAPPVAKVARPSPQLARRVAGTVRTMFWPARGLITSGFGWRWRRHHDGIDLAAPHGSPIYAARSGRVTFAGWYFGYGRMIKIDHGGGLTTQYGHNSANLVRMGQFVERGQLIARVGCTGSCTGAHVHFEVHVGGRPVNPLTYLR